MLNREEREKITDLIEATAEIVGTPLKPTVIYLMVNDLAEFDYAAIVQALNACRREVKGRLALKDIIDRIDDKNVLPSADEMFSQIADWCLDERKTFVLPEIAFRACEETNGGVYEALMNGDRTGARMAFKSAYERLVKGFNGKVEYALRLGADHAERESAIKMAVLENKIGKETALKYLSEIDFSESYALPNPENVARIERMMSQILDNKRIS